MKTLKTGISRRKWGIYLSFLITYSILMFGLGNWFYANFEVRSPVIKRDTTIVSPVSNKTSLVPHVEVANAEAPVDESPSSDLLVREQEPELKSLVRRHFPDDKQWQCVDELVFKESSWSPTATNLSSGAYGLYQILPFEKSACTRDNIECQTLWFEAYVTGDRYDSPCEALAFHQSRGWY